MSALALAFDLGTTTLAASLVDIGGRTRIGLAGCMNPQRSFGADVVSRLEAAVNSEEAHRQMCGLIRAELLNLASQLLEQNHCGWDRVARAALAGNPAMQHILLGLPVRSLAFPPFRPLHTGGTRLSTTDLGWPAAIPLYLFPMPGGFVGGDTVAFLHGQTDAARALPAGEAESALYLDMGTNGEMALTSGDIIWATSAAAGPAFEGGNLSCGMPALDGAICHVAFESGRVKTRTIGTTDPRGLCGSAALQAMALLIEHGAVDPRGRLKNRHEISSPIGDRIAEYSGEPAFILHRDATRTLALTQGDIRQIQLAKAAIRAGLEVLADRARIRFEAMRDVVLTGSFGAVLQPEWLKTIGIFDETVIHNIRFVSEGALTGVEQALYSPDDYSPVETLGRRFRVVPLSGTPRFEEAFIRSIDFPQSDT